MIRQTNIVSLECDSCGYVEKADNGGSAWRRLKVVPIPGALSMVELEAELDLCESCVTTVLAYKFPRYRAMREAEIARGR